MQTYAPDMKLVIVESPLRAFMRPLLTYVEVLHEQHPGGFLTIVVPEFHHRALVGTVLAQSHGRAFDRGIQTAPEHRGGQRTLSAEKINPMLYR